MTPHTHAPFSTPWKTFFHTVENPVRRPQDREAEDFFRDGAESPAKIS